MNDLTMQDVLQYAYCYAQFAQNLFTPEDKGYSDWAKASAQLATLCQDKELGKYTLTAIKSKL